MKVLVIGASGLLGTQLMNKLGKSVVGYDLPEFDITNRNSVESVIKLEQPDLIINSSAITDVDYCEKYPDEADAVHFRGVQYLAQTGIRLITISTDQVFSGVSDKYLLESDKPNPENYYAISKLKGEQEALKYSGNVVIRTSWLFHLKGLLPWMVNKLKNGETVTAVTDQTACITSADSLIKVVHELSIDTEKNGLYHCVNRGAITPFALALLLKRKIGRGAVEPVAWSDLNLPASRPFWSALGTEKEIVTPGMEEVIEICLGRML